MSIDLIGLLVLVGFYVFIFIVGVFAARKYGGSSNGNSVLESSVVANRNIGGLVGIFTMTGLSELLFFCIGYKAWFGRVVGLFIPN